jgi:hypothetical protein
MQLGKLDDHAIEQLINEAGWTFKPPQERSIAERAMFERAAETIKTAYHRGFQDGARAQYVHDHTRTSEAVKPD